MHVQAGKAIPPPPTLPDWRRLLLVTCGAAYLYSSMEWLFFLTKPSFLQDLEFSQQVQILLSSSAWMAATNLLATGALYLLSSLIWRLIPAGQSGRLTGLLRVGTAALPGLVPTLTLAAISLLMVDNFTYTLWTFGIATAHGAQRIVYALVFLVLIAIYWRKISRYTQTSAPRVRPCLIWSVTGLALLPLLLGHWRGEAHPLQAGDPPADRPHILLITADAVDASHLTVYGYPRNTSPRLFEISQTALVAENAFANANKTSGSVISIYTGKYPSETRVLFPPDILHGADAFQHLPGILRQHGYRTVQISYAHYVDAYSLNVQEGFAVANERSSLADLLPHALRTYLYEDQVYYLTTLADRLWERLGHIFFIRTMINPYGLTNDVAVAVDDSGRLEQVLAEIRQADQPLFIHLHFMGTHGAFYYPERRVFSIGKANSLAWDIDLYDDSILEFDSQVGLIVDELTRMGLYEDTLLIIASDHGYKFRAHARLPMIIHFPADRQDLAGQAGRRIQVNVQNLDLAPTILEVLGLEKPDWMAGMSLLNADLPQRPIVSFIATVKEIERTGAGWVDFDLDKLTPPFYQFESMEVIYCNRWYNLVLNRKQWSYGKVIGYTAECPIADQPGHAQVFAWMLDVLHQSGFDIAYLHFFSPLGEPTDTR